MITLTEEMFAVGKPIAQGEVLIWMRKYAPKAVLEKIESGEMTEMKLEHGQLILGHSETGHHHILEPTNKEIPIESVITALVTKLNDSFVDLKIEQDCELKHLRSTDTHSGYILPKGEYVRAIREEQTIEGWRRVAD